MNAAASFASLTIGWIVAYGVWVFRAVFGPGFGEITDFAFMTFWPAALLTLGWAVFVLPALRVAAVESILADARVSWLAWPLLTGVAYFVLVMSWVRGSANLFWFPTIVGFVAGFVYPWASRLPKRPALVVAAPLAAIFGFWLVVWPLLERLSPYTTYVLGADGARSRSLRRILSGIEVGDSYSDLSRRYPRIFETPTAGIVANSSGGGHNFTYRVEFDEVRGRVTRVEVKPVPR